PSKSEHLPFEFWLCPNSKLLKVNKPSKLMQLRKLGGTFQTGSS
ncbi:24797_t:CDS:1, partial [Racocetra persica]